MRLHIYLLPDIAVESPSENETNVNMISILHNILNAVSKSFENNDISIKHHAILVILFQSLDILYTNISLTIEQAAGVTHRLNNNVDFQKSNKAIFQVVAWLQNYCEYYSFGEQDLTIMHKLLFAQLIRVKNGEILSSIAKQIERLYGQIEDVCSFTLQTCFFESIIFNGIFHLLGAN